MNILYISHSFGAWGTPDRVWDHNIRDTFVNLGIKLLEPIFDPNAAHIECTHDQTGHAREMYSDLLYRSVKDLISSNAIDIMFTYYDNRNVLPETIDKIKDLGVLTINFFCNAAHEYHKINRIAPHFDFCIVPEKSAIKKYLDGGANPVHIPLAANPKFYRALDLPFQYDAVFIGTKYLNREEHLLHLYKSGVYIKVFGQGWKPRRPGFKDISVSQFPKRLVSFLTWPLPVYFRSWKGNGLPYTYSGSPVSDQELIDLYNQSRIVLGLSDVIDQTGRIIRHVRLRDFEIPMCGAFYLTGYQEELADYYEIGKEIECYDTIEELVEKSKYYLQNSGAREQIRKAGFIRARKDHTWERRFSTLFERIGLSIN